MARRAAIVLEAVDRASPVFGKVKMGLAGLGAAATAVGAYSIGRVLVQGIEASVAAAAEGEVAEAKLANALRNAGEAVASALPALKERASALSEQVAIEDDVILSNQALLVSLGRLSGEGLDRATRAAIDLSAATGKDLNASFETVAKAAAGNLTALGKLGIKVEESVPQTEKFGRALDLLESKFGGSAAAQVETYTGRVAQLGVAFDNLKGTIGGPIMEVGREFLANFLNPLVSETNKNLQATDVYRQTVLDLGIALTYILEPVEILAENFEVLAASAAIASKGALASGEDYRRLWSALVAGLDMTAERAAATRAALEALKLTGPKTPTGGPGAGLVDALEDAGNTSKKTAADFVADWQGPLQAVAQLDEKLRELGIGSSAQLQERAGMIQESFRLASAALSEGEITPERFREIADALGEVASAIADEGGVVPGFERLVEVVDVELGSAMLRFIEIGPRALKSEFQRLGLEVEALGTSINRELRGAGVNAAMALGDALIDAATGAKTNWGDFLRELIKGLARAVVQAVILRGIMRAFGFAEGGMAGGGAGSRAAASAREAQSARTYAGGGLVAGSAIRGDVVPALLTPGEMVLTRGQQAALAGMIGGGPLTVRVELGPNLAGLARELSVEVERGGARLVASELAGPRFRRTA